MYVLSPLRRISPIDVPRYTQSQPKIGSPPDPVIGGPWIQPLTARVCVYVCVYVGSKIQFSLPR